MKSLKYKSLKLRNRKKFVPGHPIHTLESRVASLFGQILLVLVGGFIGIMGNQWFFVENKRTESQIQLQQQLAKDKIPFYTRIVNFTGNNQITSFSNISTKYDIKKTTNYDHSIKIDTINTISDTTRYTVPSFVVDSSARTDFMADINEIKKNKDKLDNEVWSKFQDILIYLENHPLPGFTKKSIISEWTSKPIIDGWYERIRILYDVADEKINNPY